jgi:hypothetical protein
VDYIGPANRFAPPTNTAADLPPYDPTFANNKNHLRILAFHGDHVTLPILDSGLHVGDGLAIFRNYVRIELFAVESLYLDKVRIQQYRRQCVFGFGGVGNHETERQKRYTKEDSAHQAPRGFANCNAGNRGAVQTDLP